MAAGRSRSAAACPLLPGVRRAQQCDVTPAWCRGQRRRVHRSASAVIASAKRSAAGAANRWEQGWTDKFDLPEEGFSGGAARASPPPAGSSVPSTNAAKRPRRDNRVHPRRNAEKTRASSGTIAKYGTAAAGAAPGQSRGGARRATMRRSRARGPSSAESGRSPELELTYALPDSTSPAP